MIGDLIGGALKIGSSIFGGIAASKAMKKAKQDLEAQRQENRNLYDRRYNEDFLNRASAQRVLNITRDNIRKRNQQAAGAQAVAGGTEESVAATKAANNEALADAVSRLAVNGERQKDLAEERYLSTDAALRDKLNGMETNRASSIAGAVKGVGSDAAGIADALDEPNDGSADEDLNDGKKYEV